MTAPISESWTRMETWLTEHAPATHAALAPPADPADIAEVERVIPAAVVTGPRNGRDGRGPCASPGVRSCGSPRRRCGPG
ncbi:hypothetical protein GCM10009801_16140 [Streptomyces albiaxialis]|uniref:Uncharacterized protein n=1 Tax=Streptomyces albiaxialis TaxID=329523 RepID=A0ABN2VQW7_9ACTN